VFVREVPAPHREKLDESPHQQPSRVEGLADRLMRLYNY